MATNFSPSSRSYVLNKFPSISQWSDTGPSWPSCVFVCLFVWLFFFFFSSALLRLHWRKTDKKNTCTPIYLSCPFFLICLATLQWKKTDKKTAPIYLSCLCSRGAFRVVRCPSCVVNNFFKHLLLPNRWANLDQTWQECSLGGPLQKLLTEFDSIKNSGCHSNEIEIFK